MSPIRIAPCTGTVARHRIDRIARIDRILSLIVALVVLAAAGPSRAQDGSGLKARHAELQSRLTNSAFGRPLYLESSQSAEDLKGDVYSVVEYPFATLQQALTPVAHWCDILILHLNVKGCKPTASPGSSTLWVAVGKKFDQAIADTYKLDFTYRVAAATPDYLQIQLGAAEGPLGTHNYRIRFEAVPIDARRSFVHMSYAYGYGLPARLAMQAYLATIGRDKVGFTQLEARPGTEPGHVRGVLGLVERNTMRYYLAIDSYLSALSLPAPEQVERRIRTWYAATERYATQLHEMDEAAYLEMKRKEIRRQNGDPGGG